MAKWTHPLSIEGPEDFGKLSHSPQLCETCSKLLIPKTMVFLTKGLCIAFCSDECYTTNKQKVWKPRDRNKLKDCQDSPSDSLT